MRELRDDWPAVQASGLAGDRDGARPTWPEWDAADPPEPRLVAEMDVLRVGAGLGGSVSKVARSRQPSREHGSVPAPICGGSVVCHDPRMRRTVLIVDDHAAFRAAARALLEAAGYEVVGEAADGRSALEAAESLGPDIVLLDIQLPDLDGFAVADLLPASGAAIVLTSSRAVSSFGRRLAERPGLPFIAKAELSAETLAAAVAG